MEKIQFHKYQGTGNDFVIIDDREGIWKSRLTTEDIAFYCDRKFGVGADGLMLLNSHDSLDFTMTYFNSDGQESSMCGNGGRCLVEFAHSIGVVSESVRFEAIDGYHEAKREPTQVRLKMGIPQGYRQQSPSQDWIDTGSPHLVNWTEEAIEKLDIEALGAKWRYDPQFSPGGTNVNFIEKVEPLHLKVRTYERGVEGETLSCGTGVTACAYVNLIHQGANSGLTTIETPGGALQVEIHHRDKDAEEVWLIGPATFVYAGEIAWKPVLANIPPKKVLR